MTRRFSIKALLRPAMLLTLLTLPLQGFALGLGDLTVSTNLNDPLEARIELDGMGNIALNEILVTIPSDEEFSRYGMEKTYALRDLRLKPATVDGEPAILIRTEGGMREPYLNFLVQIEWPGGKLIREYTILLSPPDK
jgi:pilus assembly protein FimV